MLKGFNGKVFKDKSTYIQDYLHWGVFTADGIIRHKSGFLERSYYFRGADFQTSHPKYKAGICSVINKLIVEMGEGWAYQFESLRRKTPNYPGGVFERKHIISYLIDKEREEKFNFFGDHFENEFYLTLTYSPNSKITDKLKNSFVEQLNKTETDTLEFTERTNEITQYLNKYIRVSPMNKSGKLSYINSTLNLDFNPIISPKGFFMIDDFIPNEVIDIGTTLKVGEYYAPIIAVKDFPSETLPMMFNNLNKSEIEYRWITKFIPYSFEEGKKIIVKYQADARGKKIKSNPLFDLFTGTKDEHMDYGEEAREIETNTLQSQYAKGSFLLGRYSSNIIVWDKDYNIAKDKINRIKSDVRSCGFLAKEETINAMASFIGSQPGGISTNIRTNTITTDNLSHVIPLGSIWKGQEDSSYLEEITGSNIPLITCSTDFGTPFYFSNFVKDLGHFVTFGVSGSGKSTFLALMSSQFMKYRDSQVIAFDVGQSLRKLTRASNGQFLIPGEPGLGFQPLGNLESESDRIWAGEFIEVILNLAGINVTPAIQKSIDDQINAMSTYDKKARTMTTFHLEIASVSPDEQRQIKSALEPYILGGRYGSILDNEEDSEILLENRMTTVEMKSLMDLGDKIVIPVLFYLFRKIDIKMRDGKPRLLLLDEVWKMIAHEKFVVFIRELLKTGRKYHMSVGMATQGLNDLLETPISSTIIEQCLTKVFLANDSAVEMRSTYEKFGCTESEIESIATLEMQKEYIYKSPLGVRKFKIELGEIQLAILTGENDQDYYIELDERIDNNPEKEPYQIILEDKKVEYKKYI